MKIAFYTLGCKVNQNETGALMQLFCENGFSLAAPTEEADVYVVNSCTVTSGGDKKSRQWLRRAKRQNPEAVTVLTGCYPQAFPEEAAGATEADVITGSKNRAHLLDDVLQFLQTRERIVDIAPHQQKDLFEELPMEALAGHTRAFMKIEDGCNRRCAYCVIPRARGNVRSRQEENVLKELAILSKAGYREVVFSGINLSSYGQDIQSSLWHIVQRASQIDGIERIRLGSLEPDLLDDYCIQQLAAVPELCPQFHLSLQSGCTATLRRMRRVYTTDEYRSVVQKLRKAFPSATFTTDIIVGFPGETDAEFAETIAFVHEIGFLKVHVFSYSRRFGTPAYDMPNQIDESIKAERNHILQKEADSVRRRIIEERKGQSVDVLLEKPVAKDRYTGYTKEYIPVLIHAPGHKQGEIVCAQLGSFDGERCLAIPLD
ncbi:tRNA (N(6)-L-threonylcarbamoyladenosine(37)-C(2))-methylthiotransferase MtaB [uncultured Ruthenibacterium sp.]|uniref:tRNA (N(6)-L-threonylcarbamoyladenosine(37)-C(2))- methylthiotransferase MtaB n=1 Tax=uncultured Ruthenibacterium sp. TaxID=1905347 RepID=UPI00349E8482